MERADGSSTTMRLSGRDFAGPDRVTMIRELLGRCFLNVDLDFQDERPEVEAIAWELPGIVVSTGRLSHVRVSSHDPLREPDSIIFIGGFGAPGLLRCRNREVASGNGDSALLRGHDSIAAETHAGWVPRAIRVDAHLLEQRLPAIDDLAMRKIDAAHPAVLLLDAYLPLACDRAILASPTLSRAAAQHIVELIAIAASSSPTERLLDRPSALAARTAVIKDWVRSNSTRAELTIDDLVRHSHLSRRSIQALFHADRTSFTNFLLEVRLDHASRMLADPIYTHRTIAAIAMGAGFNDISYFNRRFRERFGCTPSDFRARSASSAARSAPPA